MPLVLELSKLPDKISRHIVGDILSEFVAAFKTNIKPNDTIPFLWLVIHKQGLLFCNTHKTRGIFQTIHIDEIDSFKFNTYSTGNESLTIIYKSLDTSDLYIELPKDVRAKKLQNSLQNLNLQILI